MNWIPVYEISMNSKNCSK